jgi:hypothetical protein
MYGKKLFQSILVIVLLIPLLTMSPTLASPPIQGKGPEGVSIQAEPTETISNAYVQASVSDEGLFVIGTTGGDPTTPDDDNKRLLFGYPSSIWSTYPTLRVSAGSTTTDYMLGHTEQPIVAPSSDGTTLLVVWNEGGVRVEQRLYFALNSDTGRIDTTAIEYTLRNDNSSSRGVGLRMMLDVMVGDNDGAPYFILGTGQVTQQFEWSGANVPDYWIAYESPAFDPNGLQGRGQLAGDNATRPDRFVIADWPQAYGTAWDYTVDTSDPVTNDSAVILYYNPITLSPGQTKTYRTHYGISGAGEVAQIELTGLEVNQAVQDWENSVVLIEDKPTFVRAHVQSTSGMVNNVTAKLIGKRNESELPGSPLRPANTGGNIDVLENPNRIQLNQSFYFRLPESWLNGTVEFEFQGDSHTIACKEHADTDSDCRVEVTFEDTPPLDVRLVGAIWKESNGTVHAPTYADMRQLAQEIEATYPIPYLKWDNPYDFQVRFEDWVADPTTLNIRLAEQRVLDGCVSAFGLGCQRIYVGVIVDPPAGTSLLGLGGIPPKVASGFWIETHANKTIIPHEIGHALGRFHTPFCGAKTLPWWHYPYADGDISPVDSGDNALYGFHITTKYVYGPWTGDLMSYCAPMWPSDWTYEALRDEIVDRFESSSLAYQAVGTESTFALLVSGIVTPTMNTGSINSIYEFDMIGDIPLPTSGYYALVLKDATGTALATYPFEPDLICPLPSGDCSGDELIGAFAVAVPANSQTAQLSLLHSEQVLASRVASAHAPAVTVSSPNGGESLSEATTVLSWSANDLDGDPLKYVVQYSADAGTIWQTMVSGWLSTTYELDMRTIAGTDQGLLRVLASDGFHTARDESDGTFDVAKHPPQVSIRTPENSSLYVGDQTIILEGDAFDNEDGQLEDTALSWTSNLDGTLGTGRSLTIVASTLTEGTHTISLTAQDSDGQTDTTNIIVEVHRERPTLPMSLAIAPDALSFTSVEGDGQTAWQALSIHNDGDGTMTWSATADESWILVSSLGGTAPTSIIVAADPIGLSIGEYTGSIIITASGAVNSPQVIGVTLNVHPEMFSIYLPLILRQP